MPWSRDPISLWPRDFAESVVRALGVSSSWLRQCCRFHRSRLGAEMNRDDRQIISKFPAGAEFVDRLNHLVEDVLRRGEATVQAGGELFGAEALAGGGLQLDRAVGVEHQ